MNRLRAMAWGFLVGIPVMVLCVMGALAALVGWGWLDKKCREWHADIFYGS